MFKRSSFQALNDSDLNDDTATQQRLRLPPISVSPEQRRSVDASMVEPKPPGLTELDLESPRP